MSKIKNFMEKPWTWGTYFKLCLASVGAYLLFLGYFFGFFHKAFKVITSLPAKINGHKNDEDDMEVDG